ncbi:hypothetical protein [Mesorhizobium sp. dw_380]|uniref:hypothetical protein n=1 Tax=Mesorhizobium sp. dw_380 TaxID=2812001 RepID=UPI001BDE935D|nr:hypothetical protein [Mesorhizobium sp. dw_380]
MRGPVVVTFPSEASPWDTSTAIVLHALLAAMLVLMPWPKRLEEERVSVDLGLPAVH